MADMPTAVPTPAVPNASSPTSDTSAKPDLKAAVSNPSEASKPVTPAEKEIIRKIKLGDTEYDETTLQKMIEKSNGADKKFLEAAKAKKEAIRFFKLAKENPKEFLKKTGFDPKKFAYDEVAEDLKTQLRDPKEVALEEAQKRLKDYEAKDEAAKKAADDANLDKQAKALEQKLHAEMIDALESFPQLPKNAHTVAQLARAIDTVREKTGVILSAKEVAPMVVNDIRRTISGVVKGASAEELISLIGEEGVAAIRKFDLARVKDPLKNGQGAATQEGEKPKAKKWKDSHAFWKSIDEEKRGQ